MKKKPITKWLFLAVILVGVVVLVSSASVYAGAGVNTTGSEKTKLADQFEKYVVPVVVSSVLGGTGISGALWLFLRLFKKKDKETIKALEHLGLTEKSLTKILLKLENLEQRLTRNETKNDNQIKELIDKEIKVLLDNVAILTDDLVTAKDDMTSGALKIINLLTEPVEEEVAPQKKAI